MKLTKTTVVTENTSESKMYGPYKWADLVPGYVVNSERHVATIYVEINGTAVVHMAGASIENRTPLEIEGMEWNQSGIKTLLSPVGVLWFGVQCETGSSVSIYMEV